MVIIGGNKMFRIAICDDVKAVCDDIKSVILSSDKLKN